MTDSPTPPTAATAGDSLAADFLAAEPAADAPPAVPEKFRDPASGAVRVDALLRSYGELERKLGQMVTPPGDDADAATIARFHRALGVPDSPDDYALQLADGLSRDAELDGRLHGAGFTPAQAQLVYDLAHDYVLPLVGDLGAEFEAERQLDRLHRHYGGEDRWRQTAGQLAAWGAAHLPAETYAALAATYDGVLAMEKMMRPAEPSLARDSGAAAGDAADLETMMRDPRYWRDRDPAFIARVSDGFRRLYPD